MARFKPKHNNVQAFLHPVTLLIAAYNEEKIISEKLENALSIDYPRELFQILVAADGSTDRTPDIVRKYNSQSIELNYIPERSGKMAAINRAMNFARGEIVVFSDANNMYEKNTIRALIAPFSDPQVGATTGAKLIIEDGRDLSSAEGMYWKYEAFIKKSEAMLGSCVSSVGEILAIRKRLYISPSEKIINDDHYIVLDLIRRGFRVLFIPEARSFEYVSDTVKDEKERRSRMNAGLYQTISMSAKLLPFNRPLELWEILSHKYLRALVPFAMVFALLSNMFLVLFQENNKNHGLWQLPSTFSATLLIIQILFYGMALLGNIVKLPTVMSKLFYLPTFLVNPNLASVKGLYIYLTNKQSHLWKRVDR